MIDDATARLCERLARLADEFAEGKRFLGRLRVMRGVLDSIEIQHIMELEARERPEPAGRRHERQAICS